MAEGEGKTGSVPALGAVGGWLENKSEGRGAGRRDSVAGTRTKVSATVCVRGDTRGQEESALVKARGTLDSPPRQGLPAVQGLRDFISGILLAKGSEIYGARKGCTHVRASDDEPTYGSKLSVSLPTQNGARHRPTAF